MSLSSTKNSQKLIHYFSYPLKILCFVIHDFLVYQYLGIQTANQKDVIFQKMSDHLFWEVMIFNHLYTGLQLHRITNKGFVLFYFYSLRAFILPLQNLLVCNQFRNVSKFSCPCLSHGLIMLFLQFVLKRLSSQLCIVTFIKQHGCTVQSRQKTWQLSFGVLVLSEIKHQSGSTMLIAVTLNVSSL